MQQDKTAEVLFFDRFGAEMDFDAFSDRGYQRVLRELLARLEHARMHPHKGFRIADLGCATGCFTKRLADLGYSVIGFDMSKRCIDHARSKYPGLDFEVGDIESLPLPDGSVDVVTLFGVLHHFPDMTAPLRECTRVLKKGGLLFAFDPRMYNPFIWLYRNRRSPFFSAERTTKNEYPLTKRQLSAALAACSFTTANIHAIAGVTLSRRSNKFSRRVRTLMPVYNAAELLFDLPLLRHALGSYLITAARR